MPFYSLATAFFGMILAGCASGRPGRLSSHAVRLDLQCQRQSAPMLCGLAAMGMIESYHHQAIKSSEIEGLRQEAESTGGVSGASLKVVLEEAGYYVAVFPGTLDRQASGLYRHIDLKRPLIVMIGTGTRHYMVAVGYDEAKSLVMLLDPASGAITLSTEAFLKEWKKANYFTLLAVPAS